MSWTPIESGPVRLWVTEDALKDPEGVRYRVTANQALAIANDAHAMLPTPKISDLIWEQAAVQIPPVLGDVVHTTDAEQSAAIDALIAGRPGLVATVGKDWVTSKKATMDRAVNYGWHTKAAAKKSGPWPAQTIAARVWQQPSTAHNYDHSDYSQVLRLVSRNAEVDGVPTDLVDILTDPSLAHWVTDEGPFELRQLQPSPAKPASDTPTPQPVAELVNAPGIMRQDNAFRYAFWQMATELGLDPNYLAVMISIESGFRPEARNPTTGASGLNQALPSTLERLGIDPAEYRQWSAIDQLPMVRRQYAPLANRLKVAQPGDYYMANFLPAYIGADDSLLLGANPGTCKGVPSGRPVRPELAAKTLDKAPTITLGKMYCGNWGFDRAKDGTFTVGDVRGFYLDQLAKAEARPRVPVFEEAPGPAGGAGGAGEAALIVLGVLGLGALALRGRRS